MTALSEWNSYANDSNKMAHFLHPMFDTVLPTGMAA